MRRALLAFVLLLACRAGGQWTPVTSGVDYQRIRRGEIDAHITRIDLGNRRIRIRASNEDDKGLTVSEFARKRDAIVAINGDYFNEQHEPIGISLNACGVWGKGVDVGRRQGLVAFGRRRAEIQQSTMNVKRWMKAGVTGWPLLVSDCKVIEDLPGSDFFTRAPHPRTAVGLSRDGKTVYFVITEGRQEGVPGLTLPELAAFLREELGVCRAMNLDGGGSSAMWVKDRIVSIPSEGEERAVGNHLAVVAASTPDDCRARKEKD